MQLNDIGMVVFGKYYLKKAASVVSVLMIVATASQFSVNLKEAPNETLSNKSN